MFWGLVLEPSKKYTQKVDQTFHISQAALDLNRPCGLVEPVQLVVEYENSSFVLATLDKKAKIYQVPLDLIFKTGDQVSFRTIGNGIVHLSGYHVLDDLDSVIMNGEEESDLDEIKEMGKVKGKRKKPTPNSKGEKKAKLENLNEGGSDDDDDDDLDEEDSEDDEDESFLLYKKQKKNQKQLSNSVSMDDEEDDDDDLDEEDEEDDDDLDEKDEEDDDDIDLDEELDDEELDFDNLDDEEEEEEEEESVKGKSPKTESNKSPQTPNGLSSSKKGKDKSAQKGKQGSPGKDGKTPKSESKQKGEKNLKLDGTQRKNEEKGAKSPKSEGSPQKKVLEGGVISEDIKVGNGPVAKPGKMANVYYVGTLASTKKQFDSFQSGAGFKFRIGRNEVIKGWDIGIVGMKVGGKRRLTIPSHLAYGSKGSPPVIPPNSTLVFTVELKGIS